MMERDTSIVLDKSIHVHKDFFDRSQTAIRDGFYLEAVFCEYAAIEGRLEVICGLLGCPCNKDLPPEIRKNINISHRIECLIALYKKYPACANSRTKLTGEKWNELKKWIRDRNTYVHGLYKNIDLYWGRVSDGMDLAVKGESYARLLYNETKRLRRMRNGHPSMMQCHVSRCRKKNCCQFCN